MSLTRILVAIDVDTDELTSEYEGRGVDGDDLDATLVARLSEFYPAADGYLVPKFVTAVIVDEGDLDHTDRQTLRGIYEVGVEGVSN